MLQPRAMAVDDLALGPRPDFSAAIAAISASLAKLEGETSSEVTSPVFAQLGSASCPAAVEKGRQELAEVVAAVKADTVAARADVASGARGVGGGSASPGESPGALGLGATPKPAPLRPVLPKLVPLRLHGAAPLTTREVDAEPALAASTPKVPPAAASGATPRGPGAGNPLVAPALAGATPEALQLARAALAVEPKGKAFASAKLAPLKPAFIVPLSTASVGAAPQVAANEPAAPRAAAPRLASELARLLAQRPTVPRPLLPVASPTARPAAASRAVASSPVMTALTATSAVQQWYAQKIAIAQLNCKVLQGLPLTEEESRFLEYQKLTEAMEEQRLQQTLQQQEEVAQHLAAEMLPGESDWSTVMRKAHLIKTSRAAAAARLVEMEEEKKAEPKKGPAPAFRNAFVMQGPGMPKSRKQAAEVPAASMALEASAAVAVTEEDPLDLSWGCPAEASRENGNRGTARGHEEQGGAAAAATATTTGEPAIRIRIRASRSREQSRERSRDRLGEERRAAACARELDTPVSGGAASGGCVRIRLRSRSSAQRCHSAGRLGRLQRPRGTLLERQKHRPPRRRRLPTPDASDRGGARCRPSGHRARRPRRPPSPPALVPTRLPTPTPTPSEYGSDSRGLSDSPGRSRSPPRRVRRPGGNWDVPEGQVATPRQLQSPQVQQLLPQLKAPLLALTAGAAGAEAKATEPGTASALPLAVPQGRAGVDEVIPIGQASRRPRPTVQQGPQPPGSGRKFCMKFLSGMCFEQGCSLRHASTVEERREGIAKFDRPCKYGIKCLNMTCLYRHDLC